MCYFTYHVPSNKNAADPPSRRLSMLDCTLTSAMWDKIQYECGGDSGHSCNLMAFLTPMLWLTSRGCHSLILLHSLHQELWVLTFLHKTSPVTHRFWIGLTFPPPLILVGPSLNFFESTNNHVPLLFWISIHENFGGPCWNLTPPRQCCWHPKVMHRPYYPHPGRAGPPLWTSRPTYGSLLWNFRSYYYWLSIGLGWSVVIYVFISQETKLVNKTSKLTKKRNTTFYRFRPVVRLFLWLLNCLLHRFAVPPVAMPSTMTSVSASVVPIGPGCIPCIEYAEVAPIQNSRTRRTSLNHKIA